VEFVKISTRMLKKFALVFEESYIVEKEMITPELLIALPPVKTGALLYRLTEDGASCSIFHSCCDNRGPTLMIIKLKDGHIFGGYNPTSWINEFIYVETDEAFLFSITDGQGRKPIRCPIKDNKKDRAIK
jgi:hypothetical protein